MGKTAVEICELDYNKLLELLNEAFAEEWLAYYQYWLGAKLATGAMRTAVEAEFAEHADEELEHAEMLAARIIQLQGTPLISPADWEKHAGCRYLPPQNPCTVALLEQNLASERCAVHRYRQICDLCHGKDYETFEIARKILHDELEHEQELEDFLADIEHEKICQEKHKDNK